MKKLLLGSVLVLSGLNGYSQMEIRPSESSWASDQIHQTLSATSPSTSRGSSGGSSSTVQAAGDTIFYESFGNGLNGDGTNGAWTNSGAPASALWEYRGTSTTPDNSTGSQGAYNNGRGPIASTTTANGFFIFDSDYLDNGGTAGNFGLGQAPSPHTGYLESPTIDLTNYGNVVFQITSFYRRFQSDCFVEFSTDGGNTWPYSIHIYGENEVSVNAATSDADITSHYVPIGVGGNANVKFRLKFDGTDTSNPNGSGYYFWQVDDIYIIEAPQNDLSVTEIYFNGVADSNSAKYHYALIPEQQASGDVVTLGAAFENLGSVTQPNVKVGVDITGPTNSTLLSTGQIASVAINTKDSIDAGTYSPGAGIGNYTYSFYATSVDSTEDNPVNDRIEYDFEVTDNEYAWATATNIGYRTTTATSSYEICVLFDFHNADTAASMRVEFNHNSNDPNDPDNLVPGSDFLTFRVIDADEFDNNNAYIGTNIAEYNSGGSTFYPVQAGDTNNVISVPLTHTAGNPTLLPGEYYACVKTFNPSAFMSSDNSRSDDNWRPGVTIVDIDDENDWGGFTVCPTITLVTKSSVDPCTGVTVTATTTPDESAQVGSISAVGSGGAPSYTYSWLYPDGTTTNTGSSITGLVQAGTYSLTVTDINGCQSAEINTVLGGCVGLADVTTSQSITFVSSSGASDGAIDLTVSGGSGNFGFAWTAANDGSYSASTEDISNLPQDDYTVVITDNQCAILTSSIEDISVWVDGIEDISFASELKVYPNPNNGTFVIDAKGVEEAFNVTVRNVVGQSILNQSFGNQSIQKEINLGNPSAGVYFIEFESKSGEIATYKMIIE